MQRRPVLVLDPLFNPTPGLVSLPVEGGRGNIQSGEGCALSSLKCILSIDDNHDRPERQDAIFDGQFQKWTFGTQNGCIDVQSSAAKENSAANLGLPPGPWSVECVSVIHVDRSLPSMVATPLPWRRCNPIRRSPPGGMKPHPRHWAPHYRPRRRRRPPSPWSRRRCRQVRFGFRFLLLPSPQDRRPPPLIPVGYHLGRVQKKQRTCRQENRPAVAEDQSSRHSRLGGLCLPPPAAAVLVWGSSLHLHRRQKAPFRCGGGSMISSKSGL
jgi:hypothetical protein